MHAWILDFLSKYATEAALQYLLLLPYDYIQEQRPILSVTTLHNPASSPSGLFSWHRTLRERYSPTLLLFHHLGIN